MKSEKNILIAFVLNLAFSVFEFLGGIFTGSVAIVSDAIHDIGDAVSIGVAYVLEKKSGGQPDKKFTYGYTRYSVLGSAITTFILLFGSVLVIYNAVCRLFAPADINYDGMIVFAVVGVVVNFVAALFTRDGESLNQKAVNLHMLEDVLGWVIVLVGAIIMRFTDFELIDPIMSIGVAVFILINGIKNMKEIIDLFLEKAPSGVDVDEIEERISKITDVIGVHHIHIWSLDGQRNYATMHIITNADSFRIKKIIRQELLKCGIEHVTLELETPGERCSEKYCMLNVDLSAGHHCHHNHRCRHHSR